MGIGSLPLLPCRPPGDTALAGAVRGLASRHRAQLLASHSPVFAGSSPATATDAVEEPEATARLHHRLLGKRRAPAQRRPGGRTAAAPALLRAHHVGHHRRLHDSPATSDRVHPDTARKCACRTRQRSRLPASNTPKRNWATMLHMSRTPTREAMLRLAGDGLVKVRPRHGMRVKPASMVDMREMRATTHDMDAALERDDLPAWAEADERFHALLVSAAAKLRLTESVQIYVGQSQRVRMQTRRLNGRANSPLAKKCGRFPLSADPAPAVARSGRA